MTVAAATERAGPRISGKQCRKECSQGFIIRRVRADACFIIYKSRAVGRSTRGRRVRALDTRRSFALSSRLMILSILLRDAL